MTLIGTKHATCSHRIHHVTLCDVTMTSRDTPRDTRHLFSNKSPASRTPGGGGWVLWCRGIGVRFNCSMALRFFSSRFVYLIDCSFRFQLGGEPWWESFVWKPGSSLKLKTAEFWEELNSHSLTKFSLNHLVIVDNTSLLHGDWYPETLDSDWLRLSRDENIYPRLG